MYTLLDALLHDLVKEFGYNHVSEHLAALNVVRKLDPSEKEEIEIVANRDGGYYRIAIIREIRRRKGISLTEAKAILDFNWPISI